MLRASLDAEDLVNGGEIDGIGGEGVKRIRGNSDDGAAIEPACSVANDPWIGVAEFTFNTSADNRRYLASSGARGERPFGVAEKSIIGGEVVQ